MPRHSNKKSNKTSSKINKNIRIKKKPAYPFGRAGFFFIRVSFWGILFLHKLLGSSELVSHHAQELLALLQYIQVNQRNLHQGII